MAEERSDRFTGLEGQYAGYTVYDNEYEKIGKVDDLFVNDRDEPEYIGVKMGFLGLSGTTLIPWEMCRVNEQRELIEVSESKDKVKDGPNFDDDQQITPDFERQVYSYYGLAYSDEHAGRSGYSDYYRDERDHDFAATDRDIPAREGDSYGAAAFDAGESRRSEEHPGVAMGDTESGEFREHRPEREGAAEPESDLTDEDELRVQRTEEELHAGTRERETGGVRVRKRVRTDREQISVPKRREEVSVERVPVEGEASGAEIGDDEIRVPVTEEEVVVEKRPVAKEEIRIRKDVVEDEEVVEDEVRREEVEVEDEGERRNL
jgi:uncharacterized protein (TIGR02271 family)